MHQAFAAILFDVDGTLLDSAEFVLGAFAHTLASHGYAVPSRVELARQAGPPLAECYRRLAPGLDPDRLCAMHRAWQRDRLHTVRPFPAAAATLRQLRAAGIRCGAVTSRSTISAGPTLELAGLLPWLEVVIAAEDCPRSKPDPAPVLVALARLGVAPAQAAMVGDTAADLAAGRAAGLFTVGALYGFWGESLAQCRPDFLIRDLGELLTVARGGKP